MEQPGKPDNVILRESSEWVVQDKGGRLQKKGQVDGIRKKKIKRIDIGVLPFHSYTPTDTEAHTHSKK